MSKAQFYRQVIAQSDCRTCGAKRGKPCKTVEVQHGYPKGRPTKVPHSARFPPGRILGETS